MSEINNNIDNKKLEKLEARAKKLAMDKSYLQLIINMMEKLSMALEMEEATVAIPSIIVDNIGGTNVILYYIVDNVFYGSDAYGEEWKVDSIDDEEIQKVIDLKEPKLIEKQFQETMMDTNEFTKGWTWLYPLKVGDELIGVLKMENLHVGIDSWSSVLPTFFNYTALLLRNAIIGHTRLQKMNDELLKQNLKLESFNSILVEREMRVIEVKIEVNTLCKELGRVPIYKEIEKETAKHEIKLGE